MRAPFENITKAYFLGIGGIGMSALARYFKRNGVEVHGYDKTSTQLTQELEQEGFIVSYEDDSTKLPSWLSSVQFAEEVLVVYTPAIPKDHGEYNYIKSVGFRIWKRSEVLGAITQSAHTIAIAGTHGKTTTSTMVAHLLKHASRNVTAFLGGISSNYGTNLLVGQSDASEIMVAEADEYDRSFLKLSPNTSVITSVDPDHLDIYGDRESMVSCYVEFASKLKPGGTLLIKEGSTMPLNGLEYKTYSASSTADYMADRIRVNEGAYVFDIIGPNVSITDVVLYCPGRHNVENALAAAVVCLFEGLTPDEIREGLCTFQGVHRRFEYRLRSDKRVVIDDYAHHPTELRAAISTVRELYPGKKILGAFQPHLFSRTRDFADGFAQSLSMLDELLMLDIYPARELPIPGITSAMILEKSTAPYKKMVSKQELPHAISDSKSDVVLILGAGDIDALVPVIVDAVSKNSNFKTATP
ncbi:MAG: UDP-N-acetylmuramate--L-alanine ligase [Bacteroidota bacterium]